MATLSPEERRLAATGRISEIRPTAATPAPAAPAATPEAAPAAPEAAAAPAAETAPAAAEPETSAPAAEGSLPGDEGQGGEGEGTKRFRFSSEDDKAVAQLAKSLGISLIEAARRVAGESQPATAAPAAAAPVPPAAPAPDPVVVEIETKITEAQARITALTAERKAANSDLDNDTAANLSDQIAELKADVRILENEKKGHEANRDRETKGAYTAAVNKSRDAVFAEFPIFKNEDSMERLALDAHVNRAINDPTRKAEFQNPDWPAKLAREFATKRGIKPGTAGAAPAAPAAAPAAAKPPVTLPKPAPQQVTPAAGAKLLTGADGRQPSAPRTFTREEALAAARTDPSARAGIRNILFKSKSG
jgi:hypothetical protein